MTAFFQTPLVRFLATPVLAGLVLTVLAPFGTDAFRLPLRVAYWVGLTLAGGLGAIAGRTILMRLAPQAGLPLRIVTQAIVVTVAVAPFVLGYNFHTRPTDYALTLFYIFVIGVTITTVAELANREPAPAAPARAPLLDRLPPKFRGAALYAISAEDHYVRIYSAAGQHMLLMRLTDAQDLAAPLLGLKPHRSWWVAEAGVAKAVRTSGKIEIHLHDGTHVPVSRAGAKIVRAAGWV